MLKREIVEKISMRQNSENTINSPNDSTESSNAIDKLNTKYWILYLFSSLLALLVGILNFAFSKTTAKIPIIIIALITAFIHLYLYFLSDKVPNYMNRKYKFHIIMFVMFIIISFVILTTIVI